MQDLKLDIYNIKGQKVKSFACQRRDGEWQDLIWDGTDKNQRPVASGVYLYQLNAKQLQSKPAKMLLLK